jgi:iron(III) transport system substrate-binding protein
MRKLISGIAAALLLAGCGGSAAPAPSGPAGSSAAVGSSGAAAQTSGAPTNPVDIAKYQGADRQQMLEAGARKEGTVTWYTSIAGDAMDALGNGFKQKYPFMQVNIFRADATDLMTKATQEAQAGRQNFDLFEGNQLLVMADARLLTPFWSPALANVPDDLKMLPEGKLVMGASDWTTLIGFGYNTKLIPENAVPKTQDDLLNPALKGKMSLAGSTTGSNWVGSILEAKGKDKGKEFLKRFAEQQPSVQQISGKALQDLIAKGEVPASPTIFRDHVRQSKDQGAPIEWVPIEPVAALVTKVGVAAKAPHPYAAMLYLDYLLGDGQAVLKAHYYSSGTEKFPFKVWPIDAGKNSDQLQQQLQDWTDLFKANFR